MGASSSFAPSPSTLGNFALGSMLAGGLLGAFGAFQEGKADAEAAEYQAQVARNNVVYAQAQAAELERRAELNAETARARGRHMQLQRALEAREMIGRQKTVLAANGVELGSESAIAIISDEAALAMLDQETIRVNAEREAIAIQTGAMDQAMAVQQQARNFDAEANLLQSRAAYSTQAGFMNAGASLLTTAGNIGTTAWQFQQQGVDTLLS